ncbi:hypothetical protein [Brevundimonas lenta]|uniref:YARHG domain-containing protein n=1 Tax=Brevundimonas lenta TaxID=424796 RepID=A0A7W6NNI0_9CAUL|nr:hypothetical protein [Brevundimonas lenta]MBB4082380.1 hypothetical protein [Brevundimonas lenta]
MTRNALIACALFAATAAPSFASAGEAPRPDTDAQVAVTLCERDALTQAAFRRNHGPSPEFVTAADVMRAREAGERWAEPKCISVRQQRELNRMLGQRTSR